MKNLFLLSNLISECCNTQIICTKIFIKFLLQDKKWERLQNRQKYILQQKNVVAGKNLPYVVHMNILVHMAGFSQPQHFFAAGCIFAVFGIALIFYPVKKTLWKFLCILFGCSHTQIFNLRAKINFSKILKIVRKSDKLKNLTQFSDNF